jgi:uncharacterized protein YktB (UPF0637 family)
MFGFMKRKKIKINFDRRVLRKNSISVLILDERWNNLFANIDKTPDITLHEDNLRELLKRQAGLNAEMENISFKKRFSMDKIIRLTTDVFDNDVKDAKTEMQQCQKEIMKINDRLEEIENELDSFPDRIREENIGLLEDSVNLVYVNIRQNQKRAEELDKIIEKKRVELMQYIDEKESISQDETDVYSYFHDLLGGEELERLDREFFK